MSSKRHKLLYKYGIYTMGYDHKYLLVFMRIAEPFVNILNGLLDIILLPTPYVSNFSQRFYRSMIKKQSKIYIKRIDKNETAKNI